MRVRSVAYWQRALEFELYTTTQGSFAQTADGRVVNLYVNENDWLRDAWAWRMAAKYRRLSYYPWLAVEPDPPPPRLLAHPRSALELPEEDTSVREWVLYSHPPAWTFLWTRLVWRTVW